MKKIILPFVTAAILMSCNIFKVAERNYQKPVAVSKTDSVKKDTGKIKRYADVISNKAITQHGLFKVHQVDERWFFEIPDTLLNLDMAVITRMASGTPKTGFPGDQVGEALVRFEKGPGNRIFLTRPLYLYRADPNEIDGLQQAVENSNKTSIYTVFNVKAYGHDSSSVIDVTDYVNSDNPVFGFTVIVQGGVRQKMTGFQQDKSFVTNIRAYPMNVEVRTLKTYTVDVPLTFELNTSIILLPKNKMNARYWDKRVGYFTKGHYYFRSDESVNSNWVVTRWRLEPRDSEIDKYMRGELVEPKKPIVFYIDPATPDKWIPYLIQGVNAWQKAFEKAGFKNAIYARKAPSRSEDSTWNIEDARHNVIVYKASDNPNATGPQFADPRTGEILETHIDWYHNVQQVLRDWYFIQASPNDPEARKPKFDDSLMGELIRFVCTHEVGHTLGLRHNFLASATVPTDSLRSKTYLDANGFCPSIMDYARFNYVAQPEDKLSRSQLMPRIGIYDEWAIEWGYRWLPPMKDLEAEKAFLARWITEKLEKDKRLWYTYYEPEENLNQDPHRRMEDLGDDAVKSGHYGILNLKRIVPNLKEWTADNSTDYIELKKLNDAVWAQYFGYINNAASIIGGVSWIPKYRGQAASPITYPSRLQQKKAANFLVKEMLVTPKWIMDDEIYELVSVDPSWKAFHGLPNLISTIQRTVLARVVSNRTANNLMVQEAASKDFYSFDELLTDLEAGIWSELKNNYTIDIYRRNLQKLYVEKLIEITAGYFATRNPWDKSMYPQVTITDVYPVVKSHLKLLSEKIDKSISSYSDKNTKLHLQEVQDRIKSALKDFPNSWMMLENSRQPTKSSGGANLWLELSGKSFSSEFGNCCNNTCFDKLIPLR